VAGLGFKDFQVGEVLTSSDVDGYLMQQTVMRFADSGARGSALGTAAGTGVALAEGMVSYLDDVNDVQVYTGTEWSSVIAVRQVVSTTKTDTFSTTSTSYVDITGLSVTITPADNTNKILLVASFGQIDTNGTSRYIRIQFLRDSTPIGVGDAASTRTQASIVQRVETSNSSQSAAWTYVDSPATTSAITYKAQMLINASTAYINRTATDSDDPLYSRGVCSLTAIEVAA